MKCITRVGVLVWLATGLNAAFASPQSCSFIQEVCADNADRVINGQTVHRDCWRYEKTYRCLTPSTEAKRCETKRPNFCATTKTACVQSAPDGTCLTQLVSWRCDELPTGDGVTLQNATIDVTYTQTQTLQPKDTSLAACEIVSKTCVDNAPKTIAVDNWPNHTTTASPACWQEVVSYQCPSLENAPSCQTLQKAHCQLTQTPTCVAYDAGHCTRYQARYACSPLPDLSGQDDIEVGDTVDVPTGQTKPDTTQCDQALQDAQKDGQACELMKQTCVAYQNEACQTYDYTYQCMAVGSNTCASLSQLEAQGHCTRLSTTGSTQTYRCDATVDTTDLGGATLTHKEEVEVASPVNTCDATRQRAPSNCQAIDSTCVEGPGTKIVDGQSVYKACWRYQYRYQCQSSDDNQCSQWANDPNCHFVKKTCPEGQSTCDRPISTYQCEEAAPETAVGQVCDGQACIEGICQPVDDSPSDDFVNAIVSAEIGREAGVYGDIANNRFFSGEHLTCRDRVGAPSCCREEVQAQLNNSAFGVAYTFGVEAGLEAIKYVGSPYVYDLLSYSDKTDWLLTGLYGQAATGVYSPHLSYWGVTATFNAQTNALEFGFSPQAFVVAAALHFYQTYASCNESEQKLALARGQNLCEFIGLTCDQSNGLVGCITQTSHYVCFNSKLARLINEAGRAQIGRGWGTAAHPDTRGFTNEELAQLDFSKMNFNDFVLDVLKAQSQGQTRTNSSAAVSRGQARVNAMIDGHLATTSRVEGATGKVRSSNALEGEP